jgi:hypothetical protein
MESLFQTLNRIKYGKLLWVAAATETIHNIEEAIWLPQQFHFINTVNALVTPFEFRIATLLMTLLIYWIVFYFNKYRNKLSVYLTGGTLFIILVNVFVPHIIASLILFKYVPGVGSGILLNIPVTLYLLRRGFKENIFEMKTLIVGSLAFAALAVPIMLSAFFINEIFAGLF